MDEPSAVDEPSAPPLTRGQKRAIAVVLTAGALAVLTFGTLVTIGRHKDTSIAVAWMEGTLSSTTPFWGLPLRWWVRIGKAMQFLAGCSVVLDLVPPHWVRRLGQRLRSAYRKPIRARHDSYLDVLREAADPDSVRFLAVTMLRSLIRMKAGASPVDAGDPVLVAGTFIEVTAPPKVSGSGPMSQGDMDAWQAAARQDLRRAHPCTTRCGDAEPLCPAQHTFVMTGIRDKLREFYGPQADTLTDLEVTAERVRTLDVAALALILGAGALVTGLPLAIWGSPGLAGFAFILFITAATGVMLALNGAIDPQPLRNRFVRNALRPLLWLVFAPVSGWLERVARMLTAAQPGHVLRYVAFVLFVVGFLADMLGS